MNHLQGGGISPPFMDSRLPVSHWPLMLLCYYLSLQRLDCSRKYTVYAYRYYGGDCNYTVQIGQKEMILIGNLGAYQFWQRIFKDKHRLQRLKHLLKIDEMKATTVLLPKIEEEWCTFHNLVQPSLHNVSEIYEDILNSLHRFRPKFLGNKEMFCCTICCTKSLSDH
ncbi:hypothetical protein OIU78_011380 [Salix suchowensis]|nr:hypothetical protein OIU78_011380 [Salix suchowensis]